MIIRHAVPEDMDRMMEIYAYARHFMAEHGNPDQWCRRSWPPEALIRSDIAAGNSYVCVCDDRIAGTFFYQYGRNIEPAYLTIEAGKWLDDGPYGVVHRLAGSGDAKGVGAFCLDWAFEKCGHLRVDTHEDNYVMQNLLKKSGFVSCGIIHVTEDGTPRLAYEKTGPVRKI